ncbi:hypothetical protein KUTeg_008765 [Tegillarca granosa]|uniref:DEP domain-containing protein n=1 Tax=Tegillarca granosa TaxID=220873 RepID=A0ABQ9FA15_TEGGR|nr:hypothetical protein KUTeg_008765 [Tegillarca granosa]
MMLNITNSSSGGKGQEISIDNLYPAIVECFVVIFAGYVAGRMNLISSTQGKGIGTFVSNFCLPALLFKNMCLLDFSKVNWMFLLSILIAKSSVFLIVAVITLLAKRPRNYGYAGLFAIFATQSNDFALGYPIVNSTCYTVLFSVQALYEKSHPEYLSYIYLIAPISLLFLNPIGFSLLEVQKRKNSLEEHGTTHTGKCTMALHVIRGILCNPIVFMTFIGIAGNFLFQRQIPIVILSILNVLGDAFSASALFYLGLSLVGKVKGQVGIGLIVPLLLIGAKTLLLPLITWEIAGTLNSVLVDNGNNTESSSSLSMYGFLYGTFPTAPSCFPVATAMVACTFLSAPLMYVSARMMTVVVNNEMDYKGLLLEAAFDTSIISVVCCVWVLILMLLSRRFKKIPHMFLVFLLISNMISCIGMIIYDGQDHSKKWTHYLQFTMILVGALSARCWTAMISLTLYLLQSRSLCFVLRMKWWIIFFAFGLPTVGSGILFIAGTHHIHDEIDPSFHYGQDQSILSMLFLTMCSTINIVCLVLRQRTHREYQTLPQNSDEESSMLENSTSTKYEKSRKTKKVKLNRESRITQNGDASSVTEVPGIEDIIPFPTETTSLTSESSTNSDTSLTGETIEDKTCSYGSCSREQRRMCVGLLRSYNATEAVSTQYDDDDEPDITISQPTACKKRRDDFQSGKFLLLLVVLQCSMFVGLFLCIWRLFNKLTTGIYVEIEFLDGVFNYGQGFLIFAIFGFDTRFMILPFIRRWRRLVYGVEVVHVPDREDLEEETLHLCHQFVKYHRQNCIKQICRDRKYRLRTYSEVFSGTDMCDWLIEIGLAKDRGEAINYGRQLLIGQVISHVTSEHHFHDLPYFYNFTDHDLEDYT